MAVTPFPFITDGIVGDVPTNWFPAADSEKGTVLHGCMGLKAVCALPECTEVRGLYAWAGVLYAVAQRGGQSVLWRIDTVSGNPSEVGTLTTSASGPLWFTNNYKQMMISDGVTGYIYTEATGIFQAITDLNFPGSAAIAYQDTLGLVVQPDSIYWFFSNPLDLMTYNSLNSYAKEGSTDNIVGLLTDGVTVTIGGALTTEFWQNTGGSNASAATATFKQIPGGLIQYGWAGPKAGCIFDNSPAWVTDKGQILRTPSYGPQIVPNDMFARALHGDGDKPGYPTYADVSAFSYVDRDHTFLQMNFPTGNETWVLDAKTNLLHKRSSLNDDGISYGRHRANCYALFNNKHYVGDYSNGTVYEMSPKYYDDDGRVFPSVIYSKEVDAGQQDVFFAPVEIRFKQGVGLVSGQGSDPQAMLEKSNDGGQSWRSIGWRSMGKIGERKKRCLWLRQGSDKRRQYRLTITDPVERQIQAVDWGTPWLS